MTWRRQVLLGKDYSPANMKDDLDRLHAGEPLWEVEPDLVWTWNALSGFADQHLRVDPARVLTDVRLKMAAALSCLLLPDAAPEDHTQPPVTTTTRGYLCW